MYVHYSIINIRHFSIIILIFEKMYYIYLILSVITAGIIPKRIEIPKVPKNGKINLNN